MHWLNPLDSSIVAGTYNESITTQSFVSHFMDPLYVSAGAAAITVATAEVLGCRTDLE